MFKRLALLILAFTGLVAGASSNDFGNFKKHAPLNVNDLYDRLAITGEIFEMSGDGERLINQIPESRLWHFPNPGETILSNWDSQGDGVKLSLRHEWSISKEGVLKVHIQQYESMTGQMPDSSNVIYGKKLRDETIVVKDLAPVTWVVTSDDKHQIVVRFTPKLEAHDDFIDPTSLPISLQNAVITDSKGRVWAAGLNILPGKYMSIKTYLGTVYMSLYPFPGATEIGSAQDNYINLKGDGVYVGIRNALPFVAGNARARIYGVVDTRKKSERRGSVYSGSGSNEKDFVESLKK